MWTRPRQISENHDRRCGPWFIPRYAHGMDVSERIDAHMCRSPKAKPAQKRLLPFPQIDVHQTVINLNDGTRVKLVGDQHKFNRRFFVQTQLGAVELSVRIAIIDCRNGIPTRWSSSSKQDHEIAACVIDSDGAWHVTAPLYLV